MRRKNKNMRHPRLRIFIVSLLLLAGAVIGILAVLSGRDTMAASAVEMPFLASSEHSATDSGMLYLLGSELRYYDFFDSKKAFTAALPSSGMRLAGYGGTNVAYTTKSLQIIGAQFPIEFSGEIIGVRCHKGIIAVHKQEDGQDAIRIFDTTGTQLDEMTFNGAYLTDFGFYTADKKVCLYSLTVSLSASTPITTLTTYSVNPPATTGVLTVQNQLVGKVGFTDKSIFGVGTSNIIRYRADGNYESYRLLSYGYKLHDFSFSGAHALFLMTANEAQGFSSVRIYRTDEADLADERITTLQLPKDTCGVFAAKDMVYVITSTQIQKYNALGVLQSEQELTFTATGAEKISDAAVLVTSGERVFLLTFK